MKKIVAILLIIVIFTSSVAPATSVFASTDPQDETFNIVLDDNGNVVFNNEQIAILNDVKQPDKPQLRIGGKKAAITIAKWILNNRKDLTNTVGSVLGRNAGVKFGAALKYMEGPLRKVTSANKAGMKAIYDIIYDGLRASGMQHKTASTLAAGVRGILEWIV